LILSGWRLIRKVDYSHQITYSFPSHFKLAQGKSVQIHAKGQEKDKSHDDLVLPTHHSWTVGLSVLTILLDQQNKKQATHIQKTS
jgi:hypothetical protein